MGLKLKQLIDKQPPYIVNKATGLVITKLTRTESKKSGLPAITAHITDPESKNRGHNCQIVTVETSKNKAPDLKTGWVKVSCDCVTGDTKVLTDLGWKTIYEIAQPLDYKLSVNYVINAKIHEGSAPYFKGKSPTWKLTLSNGKSISATKDHKFLVSKHGSKNIWRKLKNLVVGDRLVLNDSKSEVTEKTIEFYEAFFIGVLMGDGTVTKDTWCDLQLYKKDAQEIIDILAKSETIESVSKVKDTGLRVTFNHRATELIHKYKFRNKESVCIQNATQLMGYVSGLTVTDGTIYNKVTKKCVYSHMSISGGEYLKELQDYLMQYGYPNVSLCLSRKKGTKTNYGVATKNMYLLNLSNRCARLLSKNLHLNSHKQSKLKLIAESKSQDRTCSTKIVDISYAGRQRVYDITVPTVSKFVANGLIVHNCEWFTFYCEYALTKWGAANIKHSNGEPAYTTNPSNYPLICKHIYALGKKALR